MDGMEFDPTPRRGFLGRLAAGAVALAAGGLVTKTEAQPRSRTDSLWDDSWLKRIKGDRRQVFDAMEINSGFPLVMAYIWMQSNHDADKIEMKDLSAVVVLRHGAIAMAMNTTIWAKYKLGETYKIMDPLTTQPATRNVFGTAMGFPIPIAPNAAIDKMVAAGVIFCACSVALSVTSAAMAEKGGVTKEVALQEWTAGLMPGITVVPSGVFAVGRAQDKECRYCNVT